MSFSLSRRIIAGITAVLGAGALLLTCAPGAMAQRAPGPDKAGTFDYYALVLSWSPTYCETEGDDRRDPQCRPRRDRPYAFVLHGLWPQYERGFPNDCRTTFRPFVPEDVIDSMLDIMPARGLVIHEYKKHGTCSGLTPERYYSAARKLFEFVKIPEEFTRPDRSLTVSVDAVEAAFMRVNPGIKPDMIAVSCRRSGRNQLSEVRICFTPQGRLRACGSNEDQRRLCRAGELYVPPVRQGR